jgi:hypothetical protein
MFREIKDQAMIAEVNGIWDADTEWSKFSADLDDDPKKAQSWAPAVLQAEVDEFLQEIRQIPAYERDIALTCMIECLETPRTSFATERVLARVAFLVGRIIGTLHQVEENPVMERFFDLGLTESGAYVAA